MNIPHHQIIHLSKTKHTIMKIFFPTSDHYPVKIHFMIHEYVLFSSRLASFAYSQVHDECWPVFDKRIQEALSMGKTIEDCEDITGKLFKNIITRLFLEKRAVKINETIMNIVKNVADFVFIVKFMRNETDHNAISKAFKKFRDFQTLKKFLLRGMYVLKVTHQIRLQTEKCFKK